MEHLVHVDEDVNIQVPLYADIDNLSGDSSKVQWDKARLESHGDLQGHDAKEVARFFQSWLYFAFLVEFFQDVTDFDLRDFVLRAKDGNYVVSTAKLQHWLIEWYVRITRTASVQQVQTELYDRYNHIFGNVYRVASLFCSVGRSAPYSGPVYPGVPEELSLSVLVLFSALEKAVTQLTARRFHYDIGNSKLLIRILHQKNWCPTDVEWLSLRNVDTLYSATTMHRPSLGVKHNDCKPWKCEAFQIDDESKYEQAHDKDCKGDCGVDGIPIEKLIEVISQDRIPVVSFDERASQLLTTSVSQDSKDDEEKDVKFVALSHVWSDGMGNPTANELPLCQLRRIQNLVDKALAHERHATRVLWWCDTLSVPARGLADEARKQAIQSMRDVYKGAHCILVLDSFLVQQIRDVPAMHAYLYILNSRWMRRLWTFHEAVLAKDILIQFKDGAAPLASLYSAMLNSKSPLLLSTWYDNDCIETMKPFVEGLDMEQSFNVGIYRSVAVRSTSRRSDETICLANVQGINIKSILDVPEEEYDSRMQEYFRLVRNLPTVLLFQRLPRMAAKGFRWAPSSLLTRFRQAPTSLIYSDREDMIVTGDEKGASVQLPGVTLHADQEKLPTGHHFGLQITDAEGIEHCFIVYYAPGEGSGEITYPIEFGELQHPSLVLYWSLWSDRFETFDRAVLVNVTKKSQDETIFAEYVALVGVRAVPSTVFEAQFRKSAHFTVRRGTMLADSTSWLLS